MNRVIVFTRTKHGADRLVGQLQRADIASAAIHGNKSQNNRQAALDRFRKGHIGVLVATDVAARGIDIDDITHVINYDVPVDPESYVHRIGRTARAGEEGTAITFCDRSERGPLADIERLIKTKIEVRNDIPDLPPQPRDTAPPAGANRSHHVHNNGGNGGNNGGGKGGHNNGGGNKGGNNRGGQTGPKRRRRRGPARVN